MVLDCSQVSFTLVAVLADENHVVPDAAFLASALLASRTLRVNSEWEVCGDDAVILKALRHASLPDPDPIVLAKDVYEVGTLSGRFLRIEGHTTVRVVCVIVHKANSALLVNVSHSLAVQKGPFHRQHQRGSYGADDLAEDNVQTVPGVPTKRSPDQAVSRPSRRLEVSAIRVEPKDLPAQAFEGSGEAHGYVAGAEGPD